jgi:predicted  nucleic acid-binding Zn-ribbon protein
MGITSSHTDSFDSDDALQHRSRSRDYNDEEGRSDRSKRRARDSRGRTIQRDSRQEQAPILDLHEADEDRRLVEKLEQEMRDEELAKSLAAREARRISVYQVQTPDVSRTRRSCNFQRIASLAIPVLVILAAVVGLAFAFSGGNGLPSLPGGDPIYNNNDPFQGKNPKDVNKWNNRGSGLTLDVLNALDDRWDVNFQIAVSDWDSGNPDALTLTTQKVAVDPNCSDVTGKLKVCNDDYGATQWRGINEVIISNGYIVSSVAKLNEYYLATADEAQRQYTTCHEIGHGFGLPHTDENFYNADLGNCMDYTINPEVNQHPDASNYSFLLDLYGPSSRRRMMRGKSNLQDIPDIPEDVRLLIEEAKHEIEFQNILKSLRFKAKSLHSNEHSESIRVNLGGGYEIEVNMLLALPDEK